MQMSAWTMTGMERGRSQGFNGAPTQIKTVLSSTEWLVVTLHAQ
jgi:hypothetical protein